MFDILKKDAQSRARLGILKTEHGDVQTPSYVIVGTHGSVRCLFPEDLVSTKTQLIIANTYHLWRGMSDDELNNYPGLHAAMGWKGALMTDSGGFQVFSLGFLREEGLRRGGQAHAGGASIVRITESGVYFRPDDAEGEELYLDAELSIRIQEQLGADIIVAFDEATLPSAEYSYVQHAMERTHRWADRSLEAKQTLQKILGVVQGGAFRDLRTESAKYIGTLPFDGFGIGSTYGDAYGGTKMQTADMLEWAIPYLPEYKSRHLFGVGGVEDVLNGVEAGIDTFDCVIPTREARHGALWTVHGRIDITKGKYAADHTPVDPSCDCPTCLGETDRSALHALFKAKDQKAGRIATIHNVYFFNAFLEKIRGAISEGRFMEFKKEYLREFHASGE